MRFDFTTPPRIIFGPGSLREAAPAARTLGAHAFVLTGRNPYRASPLLAQLATARIAATTFAIAGEPTTDHIATATARARATGCDFVIGFGGGSVIDSAKAVGALLTNPGEPLDYLEVVGRGATLAHPAAPCLAIPTTAGTGAEVTRNAVLLSAQHRVKASLRSPHMLPRAAIVDPELTLGVPPAITASTGLDALTQLIEPYTSCRANPYTDALALDGLRRAAPALRRAFRDGSDAAARADLSLAALYSGLCLANAGLGAVHGFAGPIGGAFPAPHGAVCAALLPHTIEINLRAARTRTPAAETERRYADVARALTGRPNATADDAAPFCRDLVAELQIPPLRRYGVTSEHLPALVEQSAKASSMKANPLPLTTEELTEILARAL
ncbi:MAG: iron-containing alcohol dehydrogenase [Verrucomicrobia bacterium]|nr:iron-containing alcohol dehydrogenase [Verrucomicrobiota bacterium]